MQRHEHLPFLRYFCRISLPLLLSFFASTENQAFAGKFDVLLGPYTFQIRTANARGGVTSVGSYLIAYQHSLLKNLDVSFGFGLLLSRFVTGDITYGIELGVRYFPFTLSGSESWKLGDSRLQSVELWKPFVGLNFHQRQFQSVQISFVGAGATVGVERWIVGALSLKGEVRGILLSGPASASGFEIDGLLGLSIGF